VHLPCDGDVRDEPEGLHGGVWRAGNTHGEGDDRGGGGDYEGVESGCIVRRFCIGI
jgi:hypothetical protein